MGNVTSRQAETYVDGYLLRLARTLDSILRTFNRKLSLLSSFFFSRIFGYNLVVVDPSTPTAGLTRKDSLVCTGNVCIVPASRTGVRQEEKRRRSERRRRAEAAALGEARLRKAGWGKVESGPNSPTTPTTMEVGESLGEVARAPAARSEVERETVGERERGKLWVMGNVQPASTVHSGLPSSSSRGAIDEQVRQRMHAQRSHLKPDSTILKRRIQPRQSSKSAHSLLASSPIDRDTSGNSGKPKIDVVQEREEESPRSGRVPVEARVLPPGALSLGPSAWQPHFSNPFTVEHEPLPTIKAPPNPASKPKLSIDTHLPPTTAVIASPIALDDQDPLSPPSRRSTSPAPPIARTGLTRNSIDTTAARRSIDASSLRSVEMHTPIDVKLLANKAVKEDKGRRVWKGEVNKAAMQHCLLQQDRRFSTAGVGGDALVRVKTGELRWRRGSSPALALENEAGRRRSVATGAAVDRGLGRVKSAARRGSSPALNGGLVGVTGTGLRVESPLQHVMR